MEGIKIIVGGTTIMMIFIGFIILYLISSIKILNEYERGVVFRLGRLLPEPKGPGIVIALAGIDRLVRVDLRTVAFDVPPQDIITRDNVSLKVNAVVYFRVIDANLAITAVENFYAATSQLAQVTLRNVLGQSELDDLLAERDKINGRLQEILDKHTEPWGVKVSLVEVKHVDLPLEMQRAMASQAEAERTRRAKIIAAEGELQASQRLSEAAKTLSENPASLQLRYLQTLAEVSSDKSSTIVFPIPVDILRPFVKS